MKRARLLLAVSLGATGAANAADYAQNCQRGDEIRRIELRAPGDVGAACDVVYVRGGQVLTPYHANSSLAFCEDKARELTKTLAEAGYDCAPSERGRVAALEIPPLAGPPSTAPVEAFAEAPVIEQAEQPFETLSLEEKLALILEDEAPPPAQPSPNALDELASLAQEKTPRQALAPTLAALPQAVENPVAPKLAEAAPQSAPIAAQKTAPKKEAASAKPAPAQTPVQSRKSWSPRSPEASINAVLRAHIAAWNEGDLDAFMKYYLDHDGLKLLAGGARLEGHGAVKKYFRDLYTDENGPARLSLSAVDVSFLSEDQAVATGRIHEQRGGAASQGSFSIVLRDQGGRWRIAHDHRESAAP